jgi:hypothetical protein
LLPPLSDLFEKRDSGLEIFEDLEKLRRLAFAEQVPEPKRDEQMAHAGGGRH